MEEFNYDQQIKQITEGKISIEGEWTAGRGLFKCIQYNENAENVMSEGGCLTMIRKYKDWSAYVDGKLDISLTEGIQKDERIPVQMHKITVADLPVFKEWQVKIDEYVKQKLKERTSL